jgi:hypothetical protein
MQYSDGSPVTLGDLVVVPVPSGKAKGRVVMLGENYTHLSDIDPEFLDWVRRAKALGPVSIIIEWVGENPFAHNDPRYAPVGRYLFSPLDEWVERAE